MIGPSPDDEFDLVPIIAKPLYFGLTVNILVPAVLLFVCFFINDRYYVENRIPEFANTLFYVFVVISLVQTGVALWWRNRLLQQPMIRRMETFQQDLASELLRCSRPVFLLISAISIWGYVYFFVTGRFSESAVFVVVSFIVFQVVRPRYGSVRKVVAHQQWLVKHDRFLRDK